MASSPENAESEIPSYPVLPTVEELEGLIPGFEVTDFLAQGGMGAIYKGLQTKLDRPVAIKILPRSFGVDHNYAERFETEAKAMAKLSHNNIVSVYDYGETTDGELLYFVMEFIEGSNLHQLLLNGPLEIDQATNVLRQVCAGLQYAHEHGIIHRDIKPSNILVDQRGVVKMADFGLAKITRDREVPADVEDEDTVLGTPDYIAPEALIEGVEIDYRVDIFSVGVLAYELLIGKLPRGTFAIPSKARSGVDRRFDDIVRTAMLEDRDKRFQKISQIDHLLADISKAPKLMAGKGKGKSKRSGPKVPRPPRPQAGKHLPAGAAKKPGAAAPAARKPAAKRKIAIPQKKAVAPAPKTGPAPAPKTGPAPAAATPAATASPSPAVKVTPAGSGGGGNIGVRKQKIRTRSRSHRQVQQPSSKSAMVAIGISFLVIVLIGVLMMIIKAGKEKEEKEKEERRPDSSSPGKKKEREDGFFGVPLE